MWGKIENRPDTERRADYMLARRAGAIASTWAENIIKPIDIISSIFPNTQKFLPPASNMGCSKPSGMIHSDSVELKISSHECRKNLTGAAIFLSEGKNNQYAIAGKNNELER